MAADLNRQRGIRLTPRQAEVARLHASGLPIKRIATELGISVSTVKTHVSVGCLVGAINPRRLKGRQLPKGA